MVRRFAVVFLLLVLLAAAGRLAMPFVARRLIRADPLAHADVIVVLGAFRLERTLEAGTLFREGWSPRILLLRPPDIASSGVLSEVHVHVPVWSDIQKDVLGQMLVPAGAISESRDSLDSTSTEAEFVGAYSRSHGYKRIIVVTSPYHTGRAGRLLRKAAGTSFQVIMKPDRYQRVDPSHWWQRAGDRLDVVLEYMKTVYGLVSSG